MLHHFFSPPTKRGDARGLMRSFCCHCQRKVTVVVAAVVVAVTLVTFMAVVAAAAQTNLASAAPCEINRFWKKARLKGREARLKGG